MVFVGLTFVAPNVATEFTLSAGMGAGNGAGGQKAALREGRRQEILFLTRQTD